MKRLLYSLLIVASLLCMASCMEIDNFDAPDAHVTGRLTDKTTGQNFITDHGDTHIRIWEMSYSTNPAPQSIPVKFDGTYNNEKLFAGTYDMLPQNGPYWPADTIRGVRIGRQTVTQNFEVTPYLHITDFEAVLEGAMLTLSCRLSAPLTGKTISGEIVPLPNILEIRPFLSLTRYCGAANYIGEYWTSDYRVNLRRAWGNIDTNGDGKSDETYTITVPVKKGYTYNVRMGANVNYTDQKFNYSEVKRIVVPND
ncbi:MAG: DUF3823 domain-containing protein [Tannerella sp.]|nr:DUF3823 domain-containing protein [Tannerella sp.]